MTISEQERGDYYHVSSNDRLEQAETEKKKKEVGESRGQGRVFTVTRSTPVDSKSCCLYSSF
jgi:hypothetical protein